MSQLKQATGVYWRVSNALRHGDTKIYLTAGVALSLVGVAATQTPDTQWRLKEHLHVLRYDLIEGNTQWRQNTKQKQKQQKATVYQLTQYTRRSTFTGSN